MGAAGVAGAAAACAGAAWSAAAACSCSYENFFSASATICRSSSGETPLARASLRVFVIRAAFCCASCILAARSSTGYAGGRCHLRLRLLDRLQVVFLPLLDVRERVALAHDVVSETLLRQQRPRVGMPIED